MNEGWISVERWDEFQHVDVKRGSGPPPWIKNYTRLLNDDDYLSLSPVRRCLLHSIWLAYAQSRSSLNADTRKLCRRFNLRVRQNDLESLVQAGFIRIVASKVQAEGKQDASSLARARVEEEEEEEKNPPTHLREGAEEGRVGGNEKRETNSTNGPADMETDALIKLEQMKERIGKEMPA